VYFKAHTCLAAYINILSSTVWGQVLPPTASKSFVTSSTFA